jgi:hypothetical protein
VDRYRCRSRLGFELSAASHFGGLRLDGAGEKFVRDFVAAWNEVMNLDRFDLAQSWRDDRRPFGPITANPVS